VDDHEISRRVDVEENPPIADSSAPGDGLSFKPDDIATKGILPHGVERREDVDAVFLRNPLN
jgi:hypothetical protein